MIVSGAVGRGFHEGKITIRKRRQVLACPKRAPGAITFVGSYLETVTQQNSRSSLRGHRGVVAGVFGQFVCQSNVRSMCGLPLTLPAGALIMPS